MWSMSRPGVATTMSVPCLNAWICGPMATPPKIEVTRRFAGTAVARQRPMNLGRQLPRRHQNEATRDSACASRRA